jgi:hypothetical protein
MTTLIKHEHHKSRFRHLEVIIDVQHCRLPEDERLRLQEDLVRLGDELLEYPESHLRLSIVYHPNQEEYHAQAWLKLPGKRFVAGRYSPWLDYSLLRCFAKLRRHIESYKEEAAPPVNGALSSRIPDAGAIIPAPEHVAEALDKAIQWQDYRLFRRGLAGYEDWLRAHVASWVGRYPQMTRQLGVSIDVDDIVEEVFLNAFEQYPHRPHGPDAPTLSDWLNKLIDPSVKAIWRHPEELEAVDFARTFGSGELLESAQAGRRNKPK